MHHFTYKNGTLHVEDVDLVVLSRAIGTPYYCYSTATIERHYKVLDEAFAGTNHLICYAVKANSNLAVLATMARLGAGMDVVSEGELRRARTAGVPANKIIFAGVGKTRDEMAYALREDILGFNVESEPELLALSEVAAAIGQTARIALRINPDVDAKTHAKISTGKSENKFGIPYRDAQDMFSRAAKLPNIAVTGVHMHIGSQITDLAPFQKAFNLLRDLVTDLKADGHKLRHIDIGGGLGVPYRGSNDVPPHPGEYARLVDRELGGLGLSIILEPGRMIMANAGILVAKVIYVKQGHDRRFTIIDAAMNDLVRPTLYDAFHDIWPIEEAVAHSRTVVQDIVGPVCETGDYVALDRQLPEFSEGDLIAVQSAGAYGAVMASMYNTRPLVPEVMVHGSNWAVVRPRLSYDQILGMDRIPNWLR